MTINRKNNIINSSLWAAYGDALGFISELADSKILFKRIKKESISELSDWERKVGGLYGPIVKIPSGAYSDDTQLRLCTSRAINNRNQFDIHAFSKIEIPVWSSYALGAGVGSKLAAESLSKKSSAWYNNFYKNDKGSYIASGGNGAAIRIQPHVWACKTPEKSDTFIFDVIKNSLTTHGHPRAIAGAVFHSICLSYVITHSKLPFFSEARSFIGQIQKIPEIIRNDINLRTAWVPLYDSQSSQSLESAYSIVSNELLDLIEKIENWQKEKKPTYSSLCKTLDLKNKSTRGSATLTSIAALAASTLHNNDLNSLMLDIVNELGSDTDSIATMVGSLRGFIEGYQPPKILQDQSYIEYDAERLYSLSKDNDCGNFIYPDPEKWSPPSSNLDYVISQDGGIAILGIGKVTPSSQEFRSKNTEKNKYYYQWMLSDFGQSFLVKCRDSLTKEAADKDKKTPLSSYQDDLFHGVDELDIDKLTSEAIKSNFDEKIIGSHIVSLSKEKGINETIAYSAIISKAIITRVKKQKQN